MVATDVVLPAHNAEATLAATLASVRAQELPPARIIVVADACEDDTASIARAGGAEVVEVDHRSAGAARNTGVAASSAQLVAFLDADDRWRPTWLSAVHRTVNRRPAADLYVGAFDELNADGTLARRSPAFTDASLTFEQLLIGNPILTSAVVVRRDAFERVGAFEPRLRHSQDWDLWLRLTASGSAAAVDGRHLDYQRVPGSLTRAGHELLSVRDSSLAVLRRAAALRPIPPALVSRARAEVLKYSAMRCLLSDAVRPARADLRAALEEQPLAPELWGLALLSAAGPETRAAASRLRQRARQLLEDAGR